MTGKMLITPPRNEDGKKKSAKKLKIKISTKWLIVSKIDVIFCKII